MWCDQAKSAFFYITQCAKSNNIRQLVQKYEHTLRKNKKWNIFWFLIALGCHIFISYSTWMQWRSYWVALVDNVQGPGAKGAPERDQKMNRKGKNRKEKEENKRENEHFQIPGRGQHRYITMSLVDDRKYQNQTLVIITQYLKYETNNGELGPPCILFSPWMTSKISLLKFGAQQCPHQVIRRPHFPHC